MKGYNFKAVSHPFEEDLTQIVNDWEVTKPTANLPFKIEDDGYVYIMASGQSNMGGREPYSNPDGYIERVVYSSSLEIPDGVGGWEVVDSDSFNLKKYQWSVYVCLYFIAKYGIKIRLIQRTLGGTEIEAWQPPDGNAWVAIKLIYDTLGSNVKPASIVMWSHGESNRGYTYAQYAPLFYSWINSAIGEGWIDSNHILSLNEINYYPYVTTVNTALQQIADENSNYRYVLIDGITVEDTVHFEPRVSAIIELGRRYIEAFESILNGYDRKPYPNRPTAPVPTVAAINADSVDLTWTAATATEVGATIKSYRLTRGVQGYRYYKDVGVTLSATILFTVASGEIEKFSVVARDSAGNFTPNEDWITVSATRP